MYDVIILLTVPHGFAGHRPFVSVYRSDAIPDIHALRQSPGVFDVAIYNVQTHHYTT